MNDLGRRRHSSFTPAFGVVLDIVYRWSPVDRSKLVSVRLPCLLCTIHVLDCAGGCGCGLLCSTLAPAVQHAGLLRSGMPTIIFLLPSPPIPHSPIPLIPSAVAVAVMVTATYGDRGRGRGRASVQGQPGACQQQFPL